MSESSPPAIVLAHAGVAAPHTHRDGCTAAAARGRDILREGGTAIEAVVEAVRYLEDDPRFNAGVGSNVRLDGHTIELDAGLMSSDGAYGAVAAVRDVPNPILLAAKLLHGPPRFLTGDGARALAERYGLTGPVAVAERARVRYREIAALVAEGRLGEEYGAWEGFDLEAFWNFPSPPPDFGTVAAGKIDPSPGSLTDRGCDTVGAVARDARGNLATATSTGGTSVMIRGRVGDSPVIGSGFYAGPAAAVTVTGEGEEIMRAVLSKWVHDRIVAGEHPTVACEAGVALFPAPIQVGVMALSASAHGCAASHHMPWDLATVT